MMLITMFSAVYFGFICFLSIFIPFVTLRFNWSPDLIGDFYSAQYEGAAPNVAQLSYGAFV
jgi:hypothetical protein